MEAKDEKLINYIKKLKGKAEITRNAHGFVYKKYEFWSKIIKIILLVSSTISTTIIFTNFSESIYVLCAGFFSLAVAIASLVEIVLNYEKDAESHANSAKLLTALIRDIDRVEETQVIDEQILKSLNEKYNWINEISPLIPDNDFLESKRRYKIKRGVSQALDIESNQSKTIKELEVEISPKVEVKK